MIECEQPNTLEQESALGICPVTSYSGVKIFAYTCNISLDWKLKDLSDDVIQLFYQ